MMSVANEQLAELARRGPKLKWSEAGPLVADDGKFPPGSGEEGTDGQYRDAEDICTPTAEIIFFTTDMSLSAALALVAKHRFTLFPLCGDSIDDLKGIVDIKDLIAWIHVHGYAEDKFDLASLLHQPTIISPTMYVADLLIHMRQTGEHLAFVADEYGGIDGLVTMHDVVTAIVGEAETGAIDSGISIDEAGIVMVDGRTRLEVLAREVAWLGKAMEGLNVEESDTVGGLVVGKVGYVPVTGEHVPYPELGCEFAIADAEPRRIRKIAISKL